MAHEPAEELALWRYHLIAEALGRRLGGKERGIIVRRIAGTEHLGPDGDPRSVSRNTIDRWVRAYRERGLAGLRNRPRSDLGRVRRHQDLVEEAVRLRLENPERSAAHIAEVLSTRHGVRIAERTLRENFHQEAFPNDAVEAL
jgi:putative transposase